VAETELSIVVPDEIATDLAPFRASLEAAGLEVGALGTAGGYLHTYDADGAVADLPQAMRSQIRAAVAAYTPPAPSDYGTDAADIDQQAADAVAALRAFIAKTPRRKPRSSRTRSSRTACCWRSCGGWRRDPRAAHAAAQVAGVALAGTDAGDDRGGDVLARAPVAAGLGDLRCRDTQTSSDTGAR
jgi:hypothetical protein